MIVRRRSYRKTRAKAIRLKAKVLDPTLGNKILPHFNSLDELVIFFDTHNMCEFYEQMP